MEVMEKPQGLKLSFLSGYQNRDCAHNKGLTIIANIKDPSFGFTVKLVMYLVPTSSGMLKRAGGDATVTRGLCVGYEMI